MLINIIHTFKPFKFPEELKTGTRIILIQHPVAPRRIALAKNKSSDYNTPTLWNFLEENTETKEWKLITMLTHSDDSQYTYWDITDYVSINIDLP